MIPELLSAALITVAAAIVQTPNPTPVDAVAQLRAAAEKTPRSPRVWYALGQAYNTIKEDALASFSGASDAPWRAMISADALLQNGRLADAFSLYRATIDALPSMITIHDSIARIYERTGHPHWAVIERGKIHLDPTACTTRRAMCEFRAGRFRSALDAALEKSDAESRYWGARAANELALAAFRRLDTLPDSPERRLIRAAVAQAQERYTDAVTELKAAVRLAPKQPELQYQLATAECSSRDYESALATLSPLMKAYPNDERLLNLEARALLELQRSEEALPLLKRLLERHPDDARTKLALGRAYFQAGQYNDAVPLLAEHLQSDIDGSLHMQLARAYSALGQRDKAAPLLVKGEELRKADDERRAAPAAAITPPKS